MKKVQKTIEYFLNYLQDKLLEKNEYETRCNFF